MKNPFLALLFLPFLVNAQSLWSPFSERSVAPAGERLISPKKYDAVRLDLDLMKSRLAAAPDWFASELFENQSKNGGGDPVLLDLPMPGGGGKTFKIWRADVLAPALADRFPEIKSYAGHALGDRSTSIRCDITPRGFHAMILSNDESPVLIDPLSTSDTEHYQVYFKKDFEKKQAENWTCSTTDGGPHDLGLDLPKTADLPGGGAESFAGDCGKLRKYRLAMACTGEYATFHGGTVALVLAAMNTTIVRVNGIYERDLGVTMQIVATNDKVIFLNAATDPYDNVNLGNMIDANQSTCDSKIGTANYDIGHVVTKANLGGLACLACPCTSSRATAGTATNSPVGDPFDVDYLAHEMGHQFNGRHTQSQSGCNNDNLAAVEPGSASTIMGYAGVCAPNIQNHSDDYFHGVNLPQMSSFILGTGSTCANILTVANAAPTAVAPVDKTIPISTPFFLTANGSDPNTDPISFCWEQVDIAIGTGQPAASNLTGPMFRSFKPTTDPTRHFPNLTDLAAGTATPWEVLPSGTRPMNFRLTVRDNHFGGGCNTQDDVKLQTSTTSGPFVVTAPNTTGITWNVGSTQTVTWNVANTSAAPVSCSKVAILLSIDGGLTYPTVLLASTNNSGTASVVVPNTPSTKCRVRVESVGNYFFDISDKNFSIVVPPTPTYVMTASPVAQTVCGGSTAVFTLDLQSILNFSTPVTLAASGNPSGSAVDFSQNPAAPSSQVTLSISNLNVPVTTTFPITINAVANAISQTQTVQLTVLPGPPSSAASLQAPSNFTTGLGASPILSWSASPAATSYLVEISTNPAFLPGTISATGTASGTSFLPSGLALQTVYYWRVRPTNQCGDGPGSQVFSFQTGSPTCSKTFTSTDVPKVISATAPPDSISSTVAVPAGNYVTDVNLTANISHTWVGDLDAVLVSPLGTRAQLFSQPGVPASDFGCGSDDIVAAFDDEAANSATVFENACGNNVPAGTPSISGNFQPVQSLSAFDGPDAPGNWRLVLHDFYATEDGGALNSWSLTVCYATANAPAALLKNDPLSVPKSGLGTVSQTHLSAVLTGTAVQAVFTLTALPTEGNLLKNGVALALGGSFTQADVNGGLIVYQHGGGLATADQFTFDLVDQNGWHWLANQVFKINIIQNTLAASLIVSQTVDCAGSSTAAVTASATGGTPPLSYSLNGGTFQPSPVFSGLPAGSYGVVVKDANGFTISTNLVAASDPAVVSVSAVVNSSDVTASATGGTGSFTYSIDGQNFTAGNLFAGLANGVYTVTAKDANGCTASTQAVVAVNTLLVGAQVSQQISCAGGSNGAVFVNVGGGQAPFSFHFSTGDDQLTGLFENLPAGSYSATVTDGQGFTATTNVVDLNEPTAITASASKSYYQITVSASGGTGALSYAIDGQNFQPSPVFNPGENGNYTIVVKDQAGCTATVSAQIAVPALTLTTTSIDAILCNGQQTAKMVGFASGGQPSYQYSLNGTDFQTSGLFTGLGAGLYTMWAKDASGHLTSEQFFIAEPTAVEVTATVFGKQITASASGGSGSIAFSLDGQVFSSQNVFENLSNGSQTIYAQDANGCIATTTVLVNYTPVSVTPGIVEPSCHGAADGSVEIGATGGIAPLEFSLDGVNFGASPSFGGLAAGDYSIFVKDATGEVTASAFTLSDPSVVTITASVLGPNITFAGMGGAGNFTYLVNGISIGAATSFDNAPPGDYTITAVDDHGCSASTAVTVEPSTLTINALDIKPVSCAGGSDGSLTVCVSGGQPPFSVAFPPGIGTTATVSGNCALNILWSGLPSGDYQIKVTDGFGIDQFLTVSLPAPPALSVTATYAGLPGASTITVTATGGTGVLTYSLDAVNFQPSNAFPNLPDGSYTVVVKDENGCTASTEVIVKTAATGEAGDNFGLEIFPNPTGGEIQLAVNQAVGSVFLLKISDAAGRLILYEKTALPRKLDLSGLPGGVYWLSLTDGKQVAVRKVVRL